MELLPLDQFLNGPAADEAGVQLDERGGPKDARIILGLEVVPDILGPGVGEAAGEGLVVVDQPFPKSKYVHAPSLVWRYFLTSLWSTTSRFSKLLATVGQSLCLNPGNAVIAGRFADR